MKITTINRATVEGLRASLQAKLDELADECGLAIVTGKCHFNESNARFEVQFCRRAESGVALTPEARSFIARAKSLGMEPSDLGRRFSTASGRLYEFMGHNSPASSLPMIGKEIETGRLWKFTTISVKEALGYKISEFKGGA